MMWRDNAGLALKTLLAIQAMFLFCIENRVVNIRKNKDIRYEMEGIHMDALKFFQYVCSVLAFVCLGFTYYKMYKKDKKESQS